MSNPVIDVDGDTATASVTWALIRRGADEDDPELARLGHYDDIPDRPGSVMRMEERSQRIEDHDAPTHEDGHWGFLRREAPTIIPAP